MNQLVFYFIMYSLFLSMTAIFVIVVLRAVYLTFVSKQDPKQAFNLPTIEIKRKEFEEDQKAREYNKSVEGLS